MPNSNKNTEHIVRLRQQAEAMVKKDPNLEQDLTEFSNEKIKAVLHELLIHKLELEIQNEELCNIRKDLEISQARYFNLFNQAPVGYICLNKEGLIIESNATAASLLGVAADEIENQPLSRHIFPEDQDIFYHHRQNLFNTGLSQVCELRMRRNVENSHAMIFWARLESAVAYSDSPDMDSQQNFCRYFRVVISDINENRKLAEQLHQAQKMETIGLLASGVAHEYNNKLAVIVGYAELALNKEISPQPARIYFEEILTAALHIAAITRQLLAIARKQMISPVVLNLNQVVERIFKMLRQVLGDEIELIWKPEPSLFPVKIDPSQIDQIVLNLCLNAKAAITGRGQIAVETGNSVLDASFCRENEGFLEGKYVTIEVCDSGCGMTSKVMAKIFEPFFTTREVGQGKGLGLATVEGIVKQNNGFIAISSKPGAGTTVKIYLPALADKLLDENEEKHEKKISGSEEGIAKVEGLPALLPMIKMIFEPFCIRALAE